MTACEVGQAIVGVLVGTATAHVLWYGLLRRPVERLIDRWWS